MDIIGPIRLFEDSLALGLLSIAIFYLVHAVGSMRDLPVRFIPIAIVAGLLPLYVWKGFGAIRRAFIDKASQPELYKTLHDVGEIFESVSGLVIAASVAFILFRLHTLRNA